MATIMTMGKASAHHVSWRQSGGSGVAGSLSVALKDCMATAYIWMRMACVTEAGCRVTLQLHAAPAVLDPVALRLPSRYSIKKLKEPSNARSRVVRHGHTDGIGGGYFYVGGDNGRDRRRGLRAGGRFSLPAAPVALRVPRRRVRRGQLRGALRVALRVAARRWPGAKRRRRRRAVVVGYHAEPGRGRTARAIPRHEQGRESRFCHLHTWAANCGADPGDAELRQRATLHLCRAWDLPRPLSRILRLGPSRDGSRHHRRRGGSAARRSAMTAQSIDSDRRSIGSLHAVFAYLAVACLVLFLMMLLGLVMRLAQ